MRAFLSFVVRRRLNALIAATGAAVLSVCLAVMVVVFPPLLFLGIVAYFVSAAVVALVALKFGIAQSLVVMIGPSLFWGAPLILGGDVPGSGALLAVPVLSTVLAILLPLALMAEVLRTTRSPALAFGLGALILGVVTLVLHLINFDPMSWLAAEMLPAIQESMPHVDWASVSGAGPDGDLSSGRQALGTGIYVANSLVVLISCLLVARWWHAVLDNPGGFGEEFRQLRFGPVLGYLAAGFIVIGGFSDGWLGNLSLKLLPCVLVLALFQGLAVAHAVANGRASGRHGLIGLYLLLIVPVFNTLSVLAVVFVGMLDPWLDFRRRWAKT